MKLHRRDDRAVVGLFAPKWEPGVYAIGAPGALQVALVRRLTCGKPRRGEPWVRQRTRDTTLRTRLLYLGEEGGNRARRRLRLLGCPGRPCENGEYQRKAGPSPIPWTKS